MLHIIAPTFDPITVAGAGVSLVELTSRFLKQRPCTRIYLNPRTAEAYPAWADATVIVPSWRMNSPSRKAAAVFKLQLGGFPRFPDDGVCWFPFGPMMPLSFRGCGVSTIHDTLDLDLPSLVAPVVASVSKGHHAGDGTAYVYRDRFKLQSRPFTASLWR